MLGEIGGKEAAGRLGGDGCVVGCADGRLDAGKMLRLCYGRDGFVAWNGKVWSQLHVRRDANERTSSTICEARNRQGSKKSQRAKSKRQRCKRG